MAHNPAQLYVTGIPEGVPETQAALCRSRLLNAAADFIANCAVTDVCLMVGTAASRDVHRVGRKSNGTTSRVEGNSDSPRPEQYSSRSPQFTFDQLVVPNDVLVDLISSIELLRLEPKVFDEWGLRQIEPFPRTALNFYGPPGTGKTLAAHALADRLNLKKLVASYAEIESKFHGDGPKNVKAIFQAAERDNAVLFIDEADSLLSKRLTNVTQGSEQAINSMRSQLLICLEQFHGVVIFSTNLVENYDPAFETRVRHIRFPLPDLECRREIWRRHFVPKLPLNYDVDPEVLAQRFDDICGRDIKNAVIDAAVRIAISGESKLTLESLSSAVIRLRQARAQRNLRTLTIEEKIAAKTQVKNALEKENLGRGRSQE